MGKIGCSDWGQLTPRHASRLFSDLETAVEFDVFPDMFADYGPARTDLI